LAAFPPISCAVFLPVSLPLTCFFGAADLVSVPVFRRLRFRDLSGFAAFGAALLLGGVTLRNGGLRGDIGALFGNSGGFVLVSAFVMGVLARPFPRVVRA
jgi:hypothetical protein